MCLMTFDEFLANETIPDEELKEKKEHMLKAWKIGISLMFTKAREFLAEYTQAGNVKIEEEEISITEDFLGTYQVNKMVIHLGNNGKKVSLIPIAADVLYAHGRIDISGLLGTTRLVLVNSTFDRPTLEDESNKYDSMVWKLVTAPPDIKYIELTKELFLNQLLWLSKIC